jgi:hypothetical protein
MTTVAITTTTMTIAAITTTAITTSPIGHFYLKAINRILGEGVGKLKLFVIGQM